MKASTVGRVAGLAAAACAAGFLAAARADLIFIDDFEDAVPQNSSPAPGMPGGGTIGGSGFWYVQPASSGGTSSVASGSLTMTQYSDTNPHGTRRVNSVLWHSEFNFSTLSFGEGLMLSVRGFEMDWDDGAGRLGIGFIDGPSSYWGSTNGAYVWLEQSGVVRYSFKENTPSSETFTASLPAPTGPERPTGFDFFVSADFVLLTAYYDDGVEVKQAGGIAGIGGPWPDLRLTLELSPRVTGQWARVALGEITVTYIPEPGTAALFGALGLAMLARRARGRPG